MKFFDTSAVMFPRDSIQLQWRWDPQAVDPRDCELVVERSGGSDGPWDTLATVDPVRVFSYHDDTAPLRSYNQNLYYRLTMLRRSNGQVIRSSIPFGFDGPLDLDARLIIAQQEVFLEGVNGHKAIKGLPVTIYKAVQFGPKCDVCRDKDNGQIMLSGCLSCVGTGYNQGFYEPVTRGMNIMPYAVALKLFNLQDVDGVETTAVMNNFPAITPGDILVERSEKHWRVKSVDVRERNRIRVRQILFLTQLQPDDVAGEILRHRDHGGRKE